MISENVVMTQIRTKGFILVITAAVLWGISGTVAQYLFQKENYSTEWLVVVRLLVSGIILLLIASLKEKQNIWLIWKNKKDALNILLFSILGMLAVQYTYFAAIKESNAATATVLQYLAPVLISCFFTIRFKKLPSIKEMIAIILALVGTFFLVTHGNIHSLSISGLALFWGLSSAVALAFYTLHPIKLLEKWGSTIIVGWGMLIGGIFFSFIHPPWDFESHITIQSIFGVIFIVIFGTLIAFYCYLESLKYINATETSLLACVEPLSASLVSVIWLQVSFGLQDWFGTLCILSTVVILSFVKNRSKKIEKKESYFI